MSTIVLLYTRSAGPDVGSLSRSPRVRAPSAAGAIFVVRALSRPSCCCDHSGSHLIVPALHPEYRRRDQKNGDPTRHTWCLENKGNAAESQADGSHPPGEGPVASITGLAGVREKDDTRRNANRRGTPGQLVGPARLSLPLGRHLPLRGSRSAVFPGRRSPHGGFAMIFQLILAHRMVSAGTG